MQTTAKPNGNNWKVAPSVGPFPRGKSHGKEQKSKTPKGKTQAVISRPRGLESGILDYVDLAMKEQHKTMHAGTKKLLQLKKFANENGIELVDAFMKVDGPNLIEILITVSDDHFDSDEMISVYKKAQVLEELPGEKTKRKILFNFSGTAEDFDERAVISDGYELKFQDGLQDKP